MFHETMASLETPVASGRQLFSKGAKCSWKCFEKGFASHDVYTFLLPQGCLWLNRFWKQNKRWKSFSRGNTGMKTKKLFFFFWSSQFCFWADHSHLYQEYASFLSCTSLKKIHMQGSWQKAAKTELCEEKARCRFDMRLANGPVCCSHTLYLISQKRHSISQDVSRGMVLLTKLNWSVWR